MELLTSFVRLWIQMPTVLFAYRLSALPHHICYIICASSEEQMVWTNARTIITVMTDKHSFWNRTVIQHPRKTMGTYRNAINAHDSITLKTATYPFPTAVLNFPNTRPESLLWCPKKIFLFHLARALRLDYGNGSTTAPREILMYVISFFLASAYPMQFAVPPAEPS